VPIANESTTAGAVAPRIVPWLSAADATQAVEYYKAAFGAIEIERLEGAPNRVEVAQLSIAGALFWVQRDDDSNPERQGGSPIRLILMVDDPDSVYARAIAAGALEVFSVHEAHGWRVGRVVDPAGHHWEIGKPLTRPS
jgi:PhnB protein